MTLRAFLLAPLIGVFIGNAAAALASGALANIFSVFLVLVAVPFAYLATALFGLPALALIRRKRLAHPLVVWYVGALLVGLVFTFGVVGLMGFKGPMLVPQDLLILGLVSSVATAFYLGKFTQLGLSGRADR